MTTNDEIIAEIEKLTDLFRRRLLNDRNQLSIINTMREKEQQLADKLQGRSLIPFLRNIRLLIERVDLLARETPTNVHYASINDELCACLLLLDIELIDGKESFDPHRHIAIATHPIPRTSQKQKPTIEHVAKIGFSRNGEVLIPADVFVAMPQHETNDG